MILTIYFNVLFQVNIVGEKFFYQTWTFDCSNPQYRGEMFCQTIHCSNKKIQQEIETEISGVDNKNFKCA